MSQTLFENKNQFHLWEHCLMIRLSRGDSLVERKKAANQKPLKLHFSGTNEFTGVESTNISSISHWIFEVALFSIVGSNNDSRIKLLHKVFQNNLNLNVLKIKLKSISQGLIGFSKRYEAGSAGDPEIGRRYLFLCLLFPPFPMNARVFSPTGL